METLPATSRALSSPELLCEILLHLDQRNLLVSCQRVCKAWHAEIHSVSALRRYLFLDLPLPRDQNQAADCRGRGSRERPTPNPLLAEFFAPWFNEEGADDESYNSDDDNEEAQSAATEGRRRQRPNFPPTELYRQFKSTEIYKRRKQPTNPFLRPGSSWLQMHVTDPPLIKLGLHRKASGQLGDSYTISEHYYPDGLRMGEFYAITFPFTGGSRRWCDMKIEWPLANMSFHRRAETNTRPGGILRVLRYSSMRRWMAMIDEEEVDFDDTPEVMNTDVVIKTSEFFGCVIHPRDREIQLRRRCGEEFMWEEFADEMRAVAKHY